ncbi:hypothetical protein KUCAC02_017796 [Chaenocephalus aceratus]|uniref:Uncharacterized protein n=1 Tax=Chaenocephalus aceratus TaxID=36190 RepID=A0ACB9W2X3_CHAAC|nr:hypothetical protein KUCAC02_017796 [Chaenocephalus aceratus]
MSSAPENRAEREGSFFSRVARSIRRALSRICRNSSSSSSDSVPNHRYSQEDYIPIIRGGSRIPYEYYGSLIGQKRKNSNEYPQISKRGDALNFTVHPESEPEQEYTLSTRPEDDSVRVQPPEAEFYCDDYDNYHPSFQRLRDIWSDFIEGTSKPLLKSLVDKLFEKKVLTDSERESAEEKQNRSDKAGFLGLI